MMRTIRYDTMRQIYLRSKANERGGQLNQAHGTETKTKKKRVA